MKGLLLRALKSIASRPTLVSDAPVPAPVPGEGLVRVSKALIAPADAAAAGILPATGLRLFSGTLGSRFVGVLKSTNIPSDASPIIAAKKSWVGKRVVATSTQACGACDLCRHGLSAHCRARTVLGIAERDGCFAEQVSVPLSSLALVPDNVTDQQAVFVTDLASALHAAGMLRGEQSSYITILGDWTLSLLTAQVLAQMNKSVRLLTSRPDRQRLCERWSIRHRPIEEPGRRQDQDVVVDCTGSSAGLRLALQMVRPRGTVLLMSPFAQDPYPPGRPMPEVTAGSPWAQPVDLTPAIVNEVQITGCREGAISDALTHLAKQQIDVSGLITKTFKFDDAAQAMSTACQADQISVVLDIN